MILRRTYAIRSYATWDDTVDAAARDFAARVGCAPNIMLASATTYRRIDMVARKDNIRDAEGQTPQEGQHTPLSSFRGAFYELDLCIDEQLPEGELSLIFDDDPDGGGEPVPDDDTDVFEGERQARSCA